VLRVVRSEGKFVSLNAVPNMRSARYAAVSPSIRLRRRLIFLSMALTTIALLSTWIGAIFYRSTGALVDALMVVLFLVYIPWPVVGFWNALLGFCWLTVTRDAVARVFPQAASRLGDSPVRLRTAVAMTLYNEPPARAFWHLRAVIDSLRQTGEAAHFQFFLLSDSTDPAIVAEEEAEMARWRAEPGGLDLSYRRRSANLGFKAGNILGFCDERGKGLDILILLDIDSLMTGQFILELVRIMQENPRLGILQSLSVGLPSASLFARLFQFGHRLGMRCFAVGAGWWQGDRCQFWGHNAAIRIEPFAKHCRLPVLSGSPPFGGGILCHDQVEAALMHRAGYEVRLLPFEGGAYEGNPPSLSDYLQRNRRWCQGNLQNLRLLTTPGFSWVSRFHLTFMAQKFLGSAALVLLIAIAAATARVWSAEPAFHRGALVTLILVVAALQAAPKLISTLDILLNRPTRFGGAARVLAGRAIEFCFSAFLFPIVMVEAACSIVILMVGRTDGWTPQNRDAHETDLLNLVRALWRPTMAGLGLAAFIGLTAPRAAIWFSPVIAVLALAIPFAMVTGSPRMGRWAWRRRLCGTAEEFDTPPEIEAVLPLIRPTAEPTSKG
jgi:membrane glycosyltransferase